MFGRSGSVMPRSRWWLACALAVVVAFSVEAADAFWTSTGSASGSGSTGTTSALTLSPGTPSKMLRPGGPADVALTISNPNPEPAHLASLALDSSPGTSGLTVDPAHSGCDTSTLSFVTQTSGWSVPARTGSVDGSLDVVLADAISMGSDAPDACQGAQFGVQLRASS